MRQTASILFFALAACAGTTGDGVESSELREVEGFSSVRNSSQIRTTVEVGPDQGLELSCDENLLPMIETNVSGDTLAIEIVDGLTLEPSITCELLVTVPVLERIDNRGSAIMEVYGDVTDLSYVRNRASGRLILDDIWGDQMHVIAEGQGRVLLSGRIGVVELDSSSEGGIRAGELVSGDANVTNSGAGDITLTVMGDATVRIQGEGDVRIHGYPDALDVNDAGCGDVVLNGDEESLAANNEGCELGG